MGELNRLQSETKNLTVLYVEDDYNAREQIKDILGLLFKNVIIANNGAEGLEKYKEQGKAIDLILTDVQMPVMDGLEMAKRIKEISPHKHLLILTAHNDTDYFVKAIDLGVDGFIIKPIASDKFLRSIERSCKMIKNQKLEELYQQELESTLQVRTLELEQSLITDEITGLYNKNKLNLDLAKEGDYAVLLVNLDNFDHINSTYGYDIGDDILRQTALFFSEMKPSNCRLYRLASDEFVFLFEDSQGLSVQKFAEELLERLSRKKFLSSDVDICLTSTVGIARGSTKQTLVDAHIAMKDVRQIGKNRYCFYSNTSDLQQKQKNNIEWMRKVKTALDQDLIIPYFQPIVNNKTQQIEKYECLARILDVNRIITPNYFIEPAKLVGMIPNITKVMLKKCFHTFASNDKEFSINITECDLRDGYLPDMLTELLQKYKIRPNRVVLEVLENISTQESAEVLSQLKKIKELGIKLALDDFGSEKSSFYRLQELNVDYIKIDGAFIKNICTNKNCFQIAKTIKQLAENLDAKVIAEFVHSQEVYNTLKELDIEFSQGYFFGVPKEKVL